MRKHIIFNTSLLAISFACFGNLQADVNEAQMRSLETRVNALEQKKGASAMVNPSGRPQVRDGADLFFTADWLIWQAHGNGLGYAVKAETGHPKDSALYDSSVKNMHFDWDSGFRVGLGWNTPHDGWDLCSNWTWFQNKASRTSSTTKDTRLLPTSDYAPADGNTRGFKSANSHWRLHLNMIDLELGREFFVSKWMTLRPFMGLRTSWINQTQTTQFSHAVHGSSQKGTSTKGKNDYWGIGPRSGLNTQWGLGNGFSLFGNGSLSLLYGFFQVESYQTQKFTNGEDNTAVSNKDGIRVGRAIGELALGVRWDTMCADDHCHFGIQAGWENLFFFGMNQFKHFTGTSLSNAGSFVANQGDLSIQGFTLSARLDF